MPCLGLGILNKHSTGLAIVIPTELRHDGHKMCDTVPKSGLGPKGRIYTPHWRATLRSAGNPGCASVEQSRSIQPIAPFPLVPHDANCPACVRASFIAEDRVLRATGAGASLSEVLVCCAARECVALRVRELSKRRS